MKKIISISIALIMVLSMAVIPTFAATTEEHLPVAIPVEEGNDLPIEINVDDEEPIPIESRNVNEEIILTYPVIAEVSLIDRIISMINRWFNSILAFFANRGVITPPDPPYVDPDVPVSPDPIVEPSVDEDTGWDMSEIIRPISTEANQTAATRGEALEIIFEVFVEDLAEKDGDQIFFEEPSYKLNDMDSAEAEAVINYALLHNYDEMSIYAGINRVDEDGTYVNICPESLVNQGYLNTILFSMPNVDRCILLKEDQYDYLSIDQVKYLAEYAKNESLLDQEGNIRNNNEEYLTRQEVINAISEADNIDTNLTVKNPGGIADYTFLRKAEVKLTGSSTVHEFSENTPTAKEIQYLITENRLNRESTNMDYDAIVS